MEVTVLGAMIRTATLIEEIFLIDQYYLQ